MVWYQKPDALPLCSEAMHKCSFSARLSGVTVEVLADTVVQEKEWKCTDWEEIELPLFTDDMIVYVENPAELAKKILNQ